MRSVRLIEDESLNGGYRVDAGHVCQRLFGADAVLAGQRCGHLLGRHGRRGRVEFESNAAPLDVVAVLEVQGGVEPDVCRM
ncbi:MAG: hypothetical protein R2742_00830 [Micropruina glycogenica]